MTSGPRRTHDFCWINVLTRDAERAKAFFGRIFGWSYAEMPGVPGGRLIHVEGQTCGALMDLAVVPLPPGTPPAIGVMVRVDDAAATVAKVASLGGRADPPVDVLENGRMAMCTDPNGVAFGVWQPRKEVGMVADSGAHGAPCWFETLTPDVSRAVAFYTALFGWSVADDEEYTRFSLGSVPIASALAVGDAVADEAEPHWGTYFGVESVDVTVRLASELGATVWIPPRELRGLGRFALLESPQEILFYVIEYGAGGSPGN